MKSLLLLPLFLLPLVLMAQTPDLPYRQIPAAPGDFGPGSILSRMVDGLGFRYYWATEGLREEDLAYRPSADARSTEGTIRHIYDLSKAVLAAAEQRPNERIDEPERTPEALRALTLQNFAAASAAFRGMSAEEVEQCQVIFKRGEDEYPFPVWNLINGQIADAIYHTGQIVSFRRSSGNPVQDGVNVFQGTVEE